MRPKEVLGKEGEKKRWDAKWIEQEEGCKRRANAKFVGEANGVQSV